jgi:hypothetical protein
MESQEKREEFQDLNFKVLQFFSIVSRCSCEAGRKSREYRVLGNKGKTGVIMESSAASMSNKLRTEH